MVEKMMQPFERRKWKVLRGIENEQVRRRQEEKKMRLEASAASSLSASAPDVVYKVC